MAAPAPPAPSSTKQLRGGIIAAVTRCDAYIKSLGDADVPFMDRSLILSQYELVQRMRSQFIDVQTMIIKATEDPAEKVKEESHLDVFCADADRLLSLINTFLMKFPPPPENDSLNASMIGLSNGDFCTMMREMMRENRDQMKDIFRTFSRTASTDTPAHVAKTNAKLPKIPLPKFSGKYTEWVPFKDRFESSVSKRPDLPDVEKLEYLMGSLEGDAASTVKHLPSTGANFKVAWDMLVERFERKNEIVAAHTRTFFNMPSVTSSDPHAVQRISNILSESMLALDAMEVTGRDPWLIQYTLEKLDTESRVLWGRECGKDVPSMDKFRKFLNQRCIDATNASSSQSKPTPKTSPQAAKPSYSGTKKQVTALHTTGTASTCRCCSEVFHPLYKCSRFLSLSPDERYETVKDLKLCRNCLAPHHTSVCTFHKCNKCQCKHNILLHDKFVGQTPAKPSAPAPSPSNKPKPSDPAPPGGSSVLSASALPGHRVHSAPKVFLATAMVDILTVDRQRISCRVMLDGGAQVCIMTTSLYQRLRLPKSPSDISILGVGSQVNPVKHRVSATIFSQKNGQAFPIECYILPKISGNIPNWAVESQAIQVPSDVDLADPQWDVQRPVDLLICGDAYWSSMLSEKISLGVGLPHLQQTAFGYVVVGEHRPPPSFRYVHNVEAIPALDEALQRFWEVEALPDDTPITDQQLAAEAHFESTHKRDSEGRFVVRLPFRDSPELLGESRPQAVRQFLSLERQFERKPQMKTLYSEVMKDYLDRGWLEEVPPGEFRAPSYYMPHHGVLKESSSTTKLRVVYNASARSSSGHSLNGLLMIGPTVQPHLAITLLRFRLHPFAMTADISKMYLQVKLDPADANFQRLVYRDNPNERLRDFRIPRVCFGVASSPFLATRALLQLAKEHEKEYPLASAALRSNFYVDDCIVSAPSLLEAGMIQKQLVEVLHKGGFLLTKWSANHPKLCLKPAEDSAPDAVSVESSIVGALGVSWDSQADEFKFGSPIEVTEDIKTKRHMASGIARFYDPLGLMGPVIIEAKCMLQDMHKLKKRWDEAVPAEVQRKWKEFVGRLQAVEDIRIPRWISIFSRPERIELHAFSDASLHAYGVAIYCVTSTSEGFCSRLLLAKSRVSPLKILTVPKLELCAAVLAVETIEKFKDALNPDSIHFWSDSTIVLHWIQSPPDAYKVFVARRIKFIRENSSPEQFRHVVTNENPADIISRGVSPSQLKDNKLWWEGPEWLQSTRDSWPPPFNPYGQAAEEANCFIASAKEFPFSGLMERYSSLPKVQRIVAYLLRFLNRGQQPLSGIGKSVGADEMDRALLFMIKLDQRSSFPGLHSQLAKGDGLSSEWKSLMPLTPFVDEDGLIRVGGRLQHADAPFSTRHPLLLPKSLLTRRIVRQEHIQQLHAAPTLLLASVRQRFWPVGGRNLVKKIVHECLKCFKAKPRPLDQLMGSLPVNRVQLYRPFQATGVDFAGPLQMLSSATRGVRSRKAGKQKVYVAIFVCMATKAAHLELVSSLSTEAFLAALRRFAARRTTPRHIHSDCGKNFEGAANEIVRLFQQEAAQREILERTQSDGIVWHFNPPASPHHGGLWEACVKSTKYHLVRAAGSSTLSYEELQTMLCQIESVLNSRPLCTLSEDPNDGNYLTPGHFLVGAPGNAPPNPDLSQIPENRLSYWQQCQARAQEFGRKWRLQYLNTLQQRPRWRVTRENLNVDDVVLLLDETGKEGSKWVLGRVERTHPGSDGRVRVVSIRTTKGLYKRPITKIARLPRTDEEFPGRGGSGDTHVQPGEHVGVEI